MNYKKLSNLFLTFIRYPSEDLPVKPRYFSVKSSRWNIIFDREGNIYLFDYFITTNIYIIHQSFVLTKYLYKYPERNDDISRCVRVHCFKSLEDFLLTDKWTVIQDATTSLEIYPFRA